MRTRLRSYLFILHIALFLNISLAAQAQKNEERFSDSLKAALPKIKDPVKKMQLLWWLDSTYITLNVDSSLKYAGLRLDIARKSKDNKNLIRALISMARDCFYIARYDDIIKYCQEAVDLCEKMGDQKKYEGIALLNIGSAYLTMGNYTTSLEYSLKALPMSEAAKDSVNITTLDVNAGLAFMNQNDLDKARIYEERGLAIAEKTQNLYGRKKTLQLLGVIWIKKNNKKEALPYMNRCIQLMLDTRDSIGLASIYDNMMAFYDDDDDSALYYGFKAKAIWGRAAPDYYVATENDANIAEIYEKMALDSLPDKKTGRTRTAQERHALLLKAENGMAAALQIFSKTKRQEDLIYFDKQLASVQHALHEDRAAYDNAIAGYTLSDSVLSQDNKNKMAGIEEQREIAVRDKQIAISGLELANQKKQRWYFISGLALLLVIGALLYRQSRARKRTNTVLLQLNTELDEANEVKTRFFNILNHDLRAPVANLISLLQLQEQEPGLLEEQVRAAHAQRIYTDAENLLLTMEDLLLWSKGQMKMFKPQVKSVAVGELFTDLQTYFSGVTNVRLTFDSTLSQLHTDEHYLKTILRNLTNNAIKALAGTPDATIVWKAWEDGGKQYLSITDNGPGVNDQQLKALYDDSATVGGKTGLGLHVVRDLARAINCLISVRSLPGNGTEFKLAL